MIDLFQTGVVPLVQIHDELCFSVENREQAEKYAEIMVNAVPL